MLAQRRLLVSSSIEDTQVQVDVGAQNRRTGVQGLMPAVGELIIKSIGLLNRVPDEESHDISLAF